VEGAPAQRILRLVSEPSDRATFSVLGFPVRVTPFFFLVVLFLGAPGEETWTGQVFGRLALWFGIVFVAILWHELGHALVMRRYGFSPSIVLHGLGGATAWGPGPAAPTPGQRLRVSLAGPFAGIAAGAPLLLLDLATTPSHWALAEALRIGWFTTFGWGVLNLVPMLPWDGGHAVESAVDAFAEGRGRIVAAVVTFAVAACIVGATWLFAGFGTGTLWITLLCLLSVATAYRALRPPAPAAAPEPAEVLDRARAALERVGPPEKLVEAVLLGARGARWDQLAEILERGVLPQLEEPTERASALELVGWARLLAADAEGAEAAAERMRPSHDPSPMLAALIAARRGRFEAALEATAAMAQPEARAARATLEAYALGALGRTDAAMARIDDRSAGARVDAALFFAGRHDAAAALAERLHERFGHPEDAYNAACSHARAGRAAEALSWLERAVDAGYDDLAHLEADEDLASVRALDAYASLRDRLS
jgi:Zn-dependent protease